MKSELNIQPKPGNTLPALYESRQHLGMVVLFTDPCHGCVLRSGSDDPFPLGKTLSCWISCTESVYWRRLAAGEGVTLTQE